jgi:hypothetical protein
MRTLRLVFALGLTVALAGAVYAGPNCDKNSASASSCSGKASIQKASTAGSGCSAAKAAGCTSAMASHCTAAEKAACAAHAEHASSCPFCAFTKELGARADKVSFTTMDTEHGVVVVFTALDKNDVVMAQTVASKAYALMNAPAHCSYSRANMESEACKGCKEGVDAFAGAEVTLENTADGAKAVVVTKNDQNVEKLQAFFKSLETKEKEAAKG